MVRASLAMYSTREEIAVLGSVLREIRADAERYGALYRIDDRGEYRHARFVPSGLFDVSATVDRLLGSD
jgi:hypothetical protein